MRGLSALEIDEESQTWALIMGSYRNIYTVYQAFRDAYRYIGKEPKFPIIARKVLENLLKDLDSRPQKAWYHTQLMHLHQELGDTCSAESHAKKAVSIIDEMDRPDCMIRLYPAYLLLGNLNAANGLACRYLARELRPRLRKPFLSGINRCLDEMELNYRKFGQAQAFEQLCERIERGQEEGLKDIRVNQLLLQPIEPPEELLKIEFEDSFNSGSLSPSWEWINPGGASSYVLHNYRIEISATNGSEWLSNPNAPSISRTISGNFAIETCMGGDKFGGLFALGDEECITLQRWPLFGRLIVLAYRGNIASRGLFNAESLILRLERKGNQLLAYCSGDGENWYNCGRGNCGWMNIGMEEPVQVGIFASCPEDAPQAVTSFDYVKIFREI